ncbi:MAG: hypothetical protein V1742_11150 [Pseudomonadota bacterium]
MEEISEVQEILDRFVKAVESDDVVDVVVVLRSRDGDVSVLCGEDDDPAKALLLDGIGEMINPEWSEEEE